MKFWKLIFLVVPTTAWAQTVCPPTPRYTPCDLVFDGTAPQALQAEFRSPKQETALVKAFDDGVNRKIIRFTPAEAGTYVYRLSDGKTGQCNCGSDFAERAHNRYRVDPESEQGGEESNASEYGGE